MHFEGVSRAVSILRWVLVPSQGFQAFEHSGNSFWFSFIVLHFDCVELGCDLVRVEFCILPS